MQKKQHKLKSILENEFYHYIWICNSKEHWNIKLLIISKVLFRYEIPHSQIRLGFPIYKVLLYKTKCEHLLLQALKYDGA